jgi:hypothetical protein
VKKPITLRFRLALAFLRVTGLPDFAAFLAIAAKGIAPPPPGVRSTDWTSVVRVPASLIDGLRTTPDDHQSSRPLKVLQLLFVRSSVIPRHQGPTVAAIAVEENQEAA